jgi:hypothetical protein
LRASEPIVTYQRLGLNHPNASPNATFGGSRKFPGIPANSVRAEIESEYRWFVPATIAHVRNRHVRSGPTIGFGVALSIIGGGCHGFDRKLLIRELLRCSHVSGMASPLSIRIVYLSNSASNRTMSDPKRQCRLIGRLSMKVCVTAIATLLGWAVTALAAPPSALTTLRTIHTLNNADVRLAQPVAFEATVVYSRGYENLLFVQDGDDAIFVRSPSGTHLTVGDRILIRGKMQASFRPPVIGQSSSLFMPSFAPLTWS